MKPGNSVTADISSSPRFVKRPQLTLHFPRKKGGGLVGISRCTLFKRSVVHFLLCGEWLQKVRLWLTSCWCTVPLISSPWGKGETRCLLWAGNQSEHFPDPAPKWLLASFLQKQFFSKRGALSGPVTGKSTQSFDPQDFLIRFRRVSM